MGNRRSVTDRAFRTYRGMGTDPDARRRLIALLLARGEIGSRDPAREGVDEPLERDVPVDVEAEAAARFERGESVHRAP